MIPFSRRSSHCSEGTSWWDKKCIHTRRNLELLSATGIKNAFASLGNVSFSPFIPRPLVRNTCTTLLNSYHGSIYVANTGLRIAAYKSGLKISAAELFSGVDLVAMENPRVNSSEQQQMRS